MLSGIKDLDYKILNGLDDKDLVNFCLTNKRADEYCNDQNYWFNRIIYKFPYIPLDVLKKYKKERTWSNYYIYDLRNFSNKITFFKLEEAVTRGRLDHVMIALNKGLQKDFIILLEDAAFNGHLEIIKYLHNKGFKLDPRLLIASIRNGNLKVVKYLVENGVNVNFDQDGETPLEVAKDNKHYEIVKYLIEKGAKE